MILTTMIKLYRFEPRIESVVIKFFQLELNSLDIELQTRSYEYLNLIQLSKLNGDMALLDALFAPMPPFNTKSNPLLNRLGNLPSSGGSATLLDSVRPIHIEDDGANGDATTMTEKPVPPPSRQSNTALSSSTANDGPSQYSHQNLSAKWEEGFARMLSHKKGVLYTSPMLRILYSVNTVDSQPYHLKIALTYVNQAEWDIKGSRQSFSHQRLGIIPNMCYKTLGPHPL